MLKIFGFLIGEARTHREDLQERENQQGKKTTTISSSQSAYKRFMSS